MIKEGYTRVSEILSQWDKFGHVNQEILSRKCAIGTQVHSAICNHLRGIPPVLDEEIEGYFNSYIRWMLSIKDLFPTSIEERIYDDKLMITGQLDLIGALSKEEGNVVIDWKTSISASKEFWSLQGAFYYMLASKKYDMAKRCIFVQLKKDGSLPKVHSYTIDEELLSVAMNAYSCYRYLEDWLKKRDRQQCGKQQL